MSGYGNVMGIIGAVVALTISLYFVAPIQTANDAFYRLNTSHCRLGDSGVTTRNLLDGSTTPPTAYAVSKGTGTACTTEATGSELTTEDGVTVSVASKNITSPGTGVWRPTPSFLGAFGTIVQLVIALVPLMIAVSFIGTAFKVVKEATQNMSEGTGMISKSIMTDVGLMLSVIVAVFVAAPFMEGVESAAGVTTAGNLDSSQQFGVIIKLAYSILPLGYATGIVAVAVRPVWGGVKATAGYAANRFGGMNNNGGG